MPYAQTNYKSAIGIPPTKYTIAQTGCFITSFCNLMERFGLPAVDPPSLNAFFRDNGIYIDVDDGVRDDVGWTTISSYNGGIQVTGVGGASTPPHNNCIVKFVYNGGNSTHFCLVNDINNGTIIDSWDGQVKSWNVYGGVKAWASYNNVSATPAQETQEMITADDVGLVRIAHSEIGNWDSATVHSGSVDAQLMGAWQGQNVKDLIWAQWSNGQPHRLNQNYIDQLNATIASLTAASAGDKDSISKAQEQAATLQKQLAEAQASLATAQASLQQPTADTQLLNDTGNIFQRLLNRLFGK